MGSIMNNKKIAKKDKDFTMSDCILDFANFYEEAIGVLRGIGRYSPKADEWEKLLSKYEIMIELIKKDKEKDI